MNFETELSFFTLVVKKQGINIQPAAFRIWGMIKAYHPTN